MIEKNTITREEEKFLEILSNSFPEFSFLIAYILRWNINSRFLIDVCNQVYKIANGSGSGKVSIVIDQRRVKSVHGVENRFVDEDVFDN